MSYNYNGAETSQSQQTNKPTIKSVWKNSKGFRIFIICMIVIFVIALVGGIVALILMNKSSSSNKSTTEANNIEPDGHGQYVVSPPNTTESFMYSNKTKTNDKQKTNNSSYLLNYINNS